MDRAEKNNEVELISTQIKSSALALCADYRGLTVSQITSLRRKLRDKGARGRVVKNTLLRIAANSSLKDADQKELAKFTGLCEGPTLFVWAEDPVSSAKVVADFAKDNAKFSVKGAWLDGMFVDSKGVEALSKMPGKEETLGMLLNLLLAPATQLVRLINAPGTQLVRVMEAYRKKLDGGEA